MKKNYFILSFLGASLLFLGACSTQPGENFNGTDSGDIDVVNNMTDNEIAPVIDDHTTRAVVDWGGTYTGTLPCADCEGIKTEITLNTDNTYQKTSEYLGAEAAGTTDSENGTFEWNTDGNTVTLQSNEGALPEDWFVAENSLIYIDPATGQPFPGEIADSYILRK